MPNTDDEVRIEEYDPSWPEEFEREKDRLLSEFKNDVVKIEHIGSTAVPSLAAKPVIDLLMGVGTLREAEYYGDRLECLGYVYQRQEDEPDRVFFRKGRPRTHHLHIVEYFGEVWQKHILFRDMLCESNEKRREYEAIKRILSSRFREDREGYSQSKSEWINTMLADRG